MKMNNGKTVISIKLKIKIISACKYFTIDVNCFNP